MCRFSAEKMYTYIRGYATGANMHETLKALAFTRKKHEGQLRESGEPYIVHPLTMACNALSLGIRDDEVVATILLHDVCEDCDVGMLVQEYLAKHPTMASCMRDHLELAQQPAGRVFPVHKPYSNEIRQRMKLAEHNEHYRN